MCFSDTFFQTRQNWHGTKVSKTFILLFNWFNAIISWWMGIPNANKAEKPN